MDNTQKVITQNDIKDIVNALIENATVSEQVLPKVIDTVKKLVNSVNSIKGGVDSVKKVVRYVNSYKDIVTTIVGTLCKDLPGNGQTISDMLGRIETPDEYDNSKTKTQWTVIDAAQQLPKIIEGTSKMFDTIAGFKMGFKAMIKFKRNANAFKWMISDALKHFVNVFADLAGNEKMDLILQKLIKQPDIVNEHIKHGYEYSNDGVKRVISDDIKKDSKQGAFGLLDIVDKTFSIMSLLNSIKLPNFIKFYITKKKLSNQLRGILETLVDVFENLNKKYGGKLFSKIQWMSRIVVGDGEESDGNKKGAIIGLFQMSLRLNMLIEQISTIKLDAIRKKKITNSFTNFGELLDKLVEIFTNDNFYALASKDTVTRVSKVSETVNSFISLISSLQDAIKGIIFLKVFKKTIINAIDTIALIVYTINRRFANVEIGNTDILSDIETIIDSLLKITKKVILLGVLALPALISLYPVRWLILGIIKTILPAIRLFAKLAQNIKPVAVRGFMAFEKILICMLMAILSIALVVVIAAKMNIAQLGISLLLIVGAFVVMAGVMWVTSILLKFLSEKSVPNMMGFMLNTLLIFGALLVAGLVIVATSHFAEYMASSGTIGNVILMLLGMVALAAVVLLLGLGLSAIAPIVTGSMIGIGQVVVIFGMLVGLGFAINTLADFEFRIGDEKTKKTAKYNIKQIFDFVGYIRGKLRGNGEDGKETRAFGGKGKWKRDKKMLRQVDQCVKEILEIAQRLNTLQNINIDTEKIIGKPVTKMIDGKEVTELSGGTVGKIFDCVNRINSALITFNTDNGNGATYRRDQVKTKRRMRRNKKILSKIDKVINKIADITESLISIKEFTLTPAEENALIGSGGSIEKIFDCINLVDEKIKLMNRTATTDEQGNVNSLYNTRREMRKARQQKREYKHNAKTMSRVEAIMLSIGGMVDSLNSISEFKYNKETVTTKVETLLTAIGDISTKINESTVKLPTEKNSKKIQVFSDYICSLGEGVKTVADADDTKLGKNINNFGAFIEKINTIEVNKLQNATNMFKQMSNFSESIKGDFDKLAESLSEKLLPVLTELKEVMTSVPEELKIGFQNTSASIAATNAPATKENITAQVNRENNNLTASEVDKIVTNRMNERAKSDANGVASKLDELIGLLKGYSGERVVVQTV